MAQVLFTQDQENVMRKLLQRGRRDRNEPPDMQFDLNGGVTTGILDEPITATPTESPRTSEEGPLPTPSGLLLEEDGQGVRAGFYESETAETHIGSKLYQSSSGSSSNNQQEAHLSNRAKWRQQQPPLLVTYLKNPSLT